MNTTQATEVQCCWCDKPATHNLDRYYGVSCADHAVAGSRYPVGGK